MRMAGLVAIAKLSDNAQTLTGIPDLEAAHNAIWSGGLGIAPAPCVATFAQAQGRIEYLFIWETPTATACAKNNAYPLRAPVRLTNQEYLFELRTPTPLDMAAGTYEATHSYSMGPGEDIDFGDSFLPSQPRFDINIILTVEHHLRVVFPPGANRLALEPEGGWLQWINRGRQPERIRRDQPFQFTASGPVKMRIECQYTVADNCAIANPAGDQVPVQTRISLPIGMHELTGGPVTKRLLSSREDVTAVPDRYVAAQAGTLHFEIERSDVDTMLGHKDTTYAGAVTVVWDSFLIP